MTSHRRSWWLLSCTEAPPVPFRRVLPSLLAVPSLACSVASLSLCPGGYLPDQHSLQSTGLAGCQIAWDTSSTWSGKRAQELLPLHLLVLCDRNQLICVTSLLLDGTLLCDSCVFAPCAWKIEVLVLALQAARLHGTRFLIMRVYFKLFAKFAPEPSS